jgi:hypothetical protein
VISLSVVAAALLSDNLLGMADEVLLAQQLLA